MMSRPVLEYITHLSLPKAKIHTISRLTPRTSWRWYQQSSHVLRDRCRTITRQRAIERCDYQHHWRFESIDIR